MSPIINLSLEEQCAEVCEWCADWNQRRATIRERYREYPYDVVPNGKFYHFASGMMVRECDATPLRQEYERKYATR